MYFKLRSTVLFRDYKDFGYLTDNRNFGYKLTDTEENYIGDKIVTESGSAFLSVLSKNPQNIEVLVKEIIKQFSGIDYETLRKDVIEFYCILEREGFIASGITSKECEEKDTRFSYIRSEPQKSRREMDSSIIQIEKSTQDYLEEYFKGKSQLTNIHIEISSRCNERCIHCYIPHDKKTNYIEPDLFIDILEQCKNLKVLHLTLSGGEPMLHMNFLDFLRKCREYDFSVNVLSNLTLLSDEIIEEMKLNPLLGVQVSLYSMDSSIHDAITQMKGSFERTKKAILRLVKNDIPLQISCPILKINKNSYNNVNEWAAKHKIHVGDDYGIIARYNHTIENLSSRLSINEIKEVIEDKATRDPNYLGQIEKEAAKKRNVTATDFVCRVCHSSICITDNGNVYPCAGWQDYVVGNIKESSLRDIWDNSEKVNYLRTLRNQDFAICMKCTDKDFCTMCMVRNANENPYGDPLVINEFFCSIAKLNKELLCERRGGNMIP